jgi:hypothetical protein
MQSWVVIRLPAKMVLTPILQPAQHDGNDTSSEGRAAQLVGCEVAMPLPSIDDAGNDSGLEGPAPAAELFGEVAMALPPPPVPHPRDCPTNQAMTCHKRRRHLKAAHRAAFSP